MSYWDLLPGGYDFSHWNGVIDWDKVAATKPAFVGLKATEGTRVDPQFEANRRGASDRAIPWIPYPFIRPDDDQSVFRAFLSVVGDKTVPAMLDWERTGVTSGTVERWIDALKRDGGRQPMAYYGRWPPSPTTPKIAACPRWYPQYPGRPDAPPKLPPWDGVTALTDWTNHWLIWQWSEKGQVPGTSDAPDDLDRLACSVEVFERWYRTGVLGATDGDPPRSATPPLLIGRIPLRRNMTGSDVAVLQRALVAHGFVVRVDQDYGPATEKAVRGFQTKRLLTTDDPGVAGYATLMALAS